MNPGQIEEVCQDMSEPFLKGTLSNLPGAEITFDRSCAFASPKPADLQDALDAIAAWVKARPTCAHEQLLVSLPRTGRAPAPLADRDVTRIVARYAQLAELPEDRRSPHVLRHTFCTHLAESGEAIEVVRELAGHADIRTTTIYRRLARRLQNAIDNAAQRRGGLGRLIT